MTAFSIDGGILFFFAVGSAAELAVFMAGWGSNNKFSMLGAMRAIAQMISYELPLLIVVLPVVMIVGSLSADAIVAAQEGYKWGIVPRWFVLTPWGGAAFILFFVAGLVESNRTPFDVPEGESEIVAGHMTEYSGFKYATFFMAEYFGMFAVSGLAVTLFLGGWHAPIAWLEVVPSYLWFFCEARCAAFRLHLDSGDTSAHTHRSDHGFRLEIHAADGVHLHPGGGCLALSGAWLGRMVSVVRRDRRCLSRALAPPGYAQEICAAHVPFRRMSAAAFIVIAIFTLAGAIAAATMPRLIHAALSLVVAFIGIAAFFFLLGAEFVGLVQIFVYVGAVAVLIVFTILLTRREQEKTAGFNWGGVVVAIAVFSGLVWAILHTRVSEAAPQIDPLTVKRIGEALMTNYVWPLQCVGLLLTAALIGALILVAEEKR